MNTNDQYDRQYDNMIRPKIHTRTNTVDGNCIPVILSGPVSCVLCPVYVVIIRQSTVGAYLYLHVPTTSLIV